MNYQIVRQNLFPPFVLMCDKVNILAIEKPAALYSFMSELHTQLSGGDGMIVLSSEDKILKLSSKAELITQFIPFEMNSKRLLNKLYAYLEKKALNCEALDDIFKLNTAVNEFLCRLTASELIDTEYDSINLSSFFKAVDLRIYDNSDSLEEKLTDYMSNVHELEGDKLFIFLNLLPFINKENRNLFFKTVTDHQYTILLIEANAVEHSNFINQMIIDEDLCII